MDNSKKYHRALQTKRIPKSISSVSLHRQPVAKKMKRQHPMPITTTTTATNYDSMPSYNNIYRFN